MRALADLPQVEVDSDTRCYDGFGCALYAQCRRTEPVPPGAFVRQAMFHAESRERGGCAHFIDRGQP